MMESRSQKYNKNSRWIWRKKRSTETDHGVMKQVQSKLQKMSITSTTNHYIPNDVMIQILSRLPGKSLLKFRWACKSWFDLITNPSFAKLQLGNHAINNPLLMLSSYKSGSLVLRSLNCKKLVEADDHSDEGSSSSRLLIPTVIGHFKSHWNITRVVGSCNGLLCLEKRTWDDVMMHHKVTFLIWNPCTNEFKESSVEPIIYIIRFYRPIIYWFGYDQTIDDYKVISNTMLRTGDHYVTVVQVYTLGTNSWRRIEKNYPFQLDGNMHKFIINRASFYSLGRESLGSHLDVILCFNIANEEYREISKPWFVESLWFVQLTELNKCLCIVQNASHPETSAVEVWMVKDYCHGNMNKNEYSWTKLYTIREPGIKYFDWFNPLEVFNKNGGEILIKPPKRNLIWYNMKDDSIRKTSSLKVCRNIEVVVVYVENLVSLNSGTYMGQMEETASREG